MSIKFATDRKKFSTLISRIKIIQTETKLLAEQQLHTAGRQINNSLEEADICIINDECFSKDQR